MKFSATILALGAAIGLAAASLVPITLCNGAVTWVLPPLSTLTCSTPPSTGKPITTTSTRARSSAVTSPCLSGTPSPRPTHNPPTSSSSAVETDILSISDFGAIHISRPLPRPQVNTVLSKEAFPALTDAVSPSATLDDPLDRTDKWISWFTTYPIITVSDIPPITKDHDSTLKTVYTAV
ncbi:hypothetical protein BS50DRAFT_665755 [Corynespora cassiicola Philippines]|uniref:Uncharacterized protein n=1 Tax=Corynespora cassiicola Philippines TaxID=1448308 RepID=A0A2T2NRW7_CORCC|nr:hypothetical protein BS50DRAFT_665755 [Corynespora cassiicola Philippines]